MNKSKVKVIISIALIVLVIFIFSTNIYATDLDPDRYNPKDVSEPIDNTKFLSKAGIIISWIQYIGILTSVIVLAIIGIKYLFSSVEGKAEYKKSMVPYVLGCFMLMATMIVVGLIADIADV